MLGKRRQSWILNSTPWIADFGNQVVQVRILFQCNLESGLQLIVGFRIPCAVFRIPEAMDSGFHKQNFPGFWIPFHGRHEWVILAPIFLGKINKNKKRRKL